MNDQEQFTQFVLDLYFTQHDPNCTIKQFRNFIPLWVLDNFTAGGFGDFYQYSDQNNMWTYDPNRPMYVHPFISTDNYLTYFRTDDSHVLALYHPDQYVFEKKIHTETFGDDNIYFAYFDNLTREIWEKNGFDKLEKLKRVDQQIFGPILPDILWIVTKNVINNANFRLQRDDMNKLRKYLYLTTSVGNRDRTTHLLAKGKEMEDARVRRQKFVADNRLDHVRDVWLQNAERIIETPHAAIPDSQAIFDLDREDYRVNARERFMVFWQAAPGEEFILTDSGFGGFEGGQIGDKPNSQVNMTSREHEQHVYTRDFMWHQLYVLSPTVVMALCHPTLMSADLIKMQKKQWGLRRSLLEDLPHTLPQNYYKDMKLSDMGFAKLGWNIPQEVKKVFGSVNSASKEANDVHFQVQRLDPKQVAKVNSVLLHNQRNGPKIKNLCLRPTYGSLYEAILQFEKVNWTKFSSELQPDYKTLMDSTIPFLPPQVIAPHLSYPPMHQDFVEPMYPIPNNDFSNQRALLPLQFQLTSNPSSQSSNTYSSASSQASTSTKTSIDAPAQSSSDLSRQEREKHRLSKKESAKAHQRGSASSGRASRDRIERENIAAVKQQIQGLNIVIDQSPAGSSSSGGVVLRGRQDPSSHRSSRRVSPNFLPPQTNQHQQYMGQQQQPMGYQTLRMMEMPERPQYVEPQRPTLSSRSRTEPQIPPVVEAAGNRRSVYNLAEGHDFQLQHVPHPTQRNQSPERVYTIVSPSDPQPPRRSRSRPAAQRLATAPIPTLRPSGQHSVNASRSPERLAPTNPRANLMGERSLSSRSDQSMQSNGSHRSHRSNASDRSRQIVDSVATRLDQAVNTEFGPPPQPRTINRSTERQPEHPAVAKGTLNHNMYEVIEAKPEEELSLPAQQPPVQKKEQPEPAQQHPPRPQYLQEPQQPHSAPSSCHSSRQSSATSERPIRAGVELVPARIEELISQQPVPKQAVAKLPSLPITIEKLASKPEVVEKPVPVAETAPASKPPVNPVVKQLRFETPPRKNHLTNRFADTPGSTVVEHTESPYQLALMQRHDSESESESEFSESETETGTDDDQSWEDEAFTDPATEKPAKRHSVRFADTQMSPVRKQAGVLSRRSMGAEIERPNSRQGRRVEISRPLASGPSRFGSFNSKKAKQTQPIHHSRQYQ